MEAEVEAIFENHVEAKVGALMKAEAEAILKKIGRKRKKIFHSLGSGSGSFKILFEKWKQKRRLLKNFQNSSLRF